MKPGRLSPDALLFPVLGVRATCPVRRRPKTAPQLQAPPPAAAAIAVHIDRAKSSMYEGARACVSRGLCMSLSLSLYVCVCTLIVCAGAQPNTLMYNMRATFPVEI